MNNILNLADNTACVVLGGSSITGLSRTGDVHKSSFYPTTVEEYLQGLVDAALEYGTLQKDKKGVLLVAAPGAFQNEGVIAGLPANFHRVKEDALQRGMPNLYFKKLLEQELSNRGYDQIAAFGYNDAVPALLATMCQPNTDYVLNKFEEELGDNDQSQYAIKYMINGTGTGEATLLPDTRQVITAEKGHLKPTLLWYQLNPFFQFMTQTSIVGENRSIERLIAGGPTEKSIRHFSKILKAALDILRNAAHPLRDGLALELGFSNYTELTEADSNSGLLSMNVDDTNKSILHILSTFILQNNPLALAFQRIFVRALGVSMAYMHFAIGEMPDEPLHTFIGPRSVRRSALGFIRTDGSTTALMGTDPAVWELLNKAAQEYANCVLNVNDLNISSLFRILNINEVFPHIHPDFGGMPSLAEHKLSLM